MQNKEIKLNLGCGNKFIKDFVNVDIVAPKGPLPEESIFVQDNIKTLETFQENSVDEIVAIHLIEHIPVYEVESTLIRWFEVLKPGGRLIIEAPCLVKSCINYLQSLTTKEGQLVYNLGLKGIFGEPDINNPYMEHKWGWTFESLGQTMRNVGFVNVQEQVPQLHMGPVRDFRLYAEKKVK